MGMITTRDIKAVTKGPRRISQLRREAQAVEAGAVGATTISDGEWSGQPCFIIGGGPSLKGFDFERLRGHGRIIAINRAFEFAPFADIHFYMDHTYRHREKTGGDLGKWNYFTGRHVFLNLSNYSVDPGIISIHPAQRGRLSRSLAEGLSFGNNSGYGAINLAYCLGANPIYLLGFDCKRTEDATHFHSGYGKTLNSDILKGFADDLDVLAPLAKEAGVRIVNLYNPALKSALTSFGMDAIDAVVPQLSNEAYFDGALGFGDNLYQRAIIKQLANKYKAFYLRTTCPDMYWDIPNVRFVHPGVTRLRTQNKYLATLPKSTFSDKPPEIRRLSWRYRGILARDPVVSQCEVLRASSGVSATDFDFSFPVKPEWVEAARKVTSGLKIGTKKLCLIRPSTIRQEWLSKSRNPKTEYFQLLIDRYKDEYFYLSFADIDGQAETLDGELRGIDIAYHKGELSMTTLFGLIKISDMLITNPTWAMLAGIAERVKTFTVFGGSAKPEAVIDASMGLENFGFAAPSPFCHCMKGDHNCKKDIPESQIIERFEELKNRTYKTDEAKPVRWESLSRKAVDDDIPPAIPVEAPKKIGNDIFFRGCYGFGDNLSQRPVIKDLAEKYETVYLKTPIPEFYWDIDNIKYVYPDDVDTGTGHRTPSKHLARLPKDMFVKKPDGIQEIIGMHRLVRADKYNGTYKCFIEKQGTSTEVPEPTERVSIFEDIRRRAGIPKEKYSFMLPVKNEWRAKAQSVLDGLDLKGKRVCLVRPPTIRKEWKCSSRNPKPEYFQLLIDKYKNEYFYISIADLDGKDEAMDGRLTGIDAEFNHGELSMTTILGLMKIADMVITGPGMGVQTAAAVRAKAFVIFGGHAGPDFILDPAMGLDNLEYVVPNPFCNCFLMEHDCNKNIPEGELLSKFEAFRVRPKKLKETTVGFPPGIGDALWPAYIFESFKEKNGIDRIIAKFREDWGYTSVFLKNVPCIDDVQTVTERLPFSFFLAGGHGKPLYVNQGGLDYMMEYGSQLELGVPLEKVIPGYEVNWNMAITGLDEHEEFVADLRERAGGRLTIIYTSSKGGNERWAMDDWTVQDWMKLIELFHQANGCKVVLTGMEYDKSYTDQLKALDKRGIIIDLTGKTPIMKSLAMLKGADLYIGFSSGLGMLACHFRTPTAIFWPIRGISKGGIYDSCFMYSWLPPWSRDSDTYAGIPYGPESKPDLVFQRLKKFL